MKVQKMNVFQLENYWSKDALYQVVVKKGQR